MSYFTVILALTSTAIISVSPQQETPNGCFKKWTGYQAQCLEPTEKRSGVTEKSCLDLCMREQPQCESCHFSTQNGVCELFNVPLTPRRLLRSGRRHRFRGSRRNKRHSPPVQRRGRRPPHRRYRSPPPPAQRTCGYGPTVTPCQGSNYFKFTNRCKGGGPDPTPTPAPITTTSRRTTTTTTTPTTTMTTATTTTTSEVLPLPDQAVCPPGYETRFTEIENTALEGNDDVIFPAVDEIECLEACTENRDPISGDQAPCLSAEFNFAELECTLSLEAFPPAGQGIPNDNEDTFYYEKICIAETVAVNCPGPFRRFPQFVLVGYAENVVDAMDLQDCMNQCADSMNFFGFECRSGMMYMQEDNFNCILNVEDSKTKPDLFIPEDFEEVDYFEINCSPPNGELMADIMRSAATDLLKKNSDAGQWNPWSPCNPNKKRQVRFRGCAQGRNPNKCSQREIRSCTSSAFALKIDRKPTATPQGDCDPKRDCCARTVNGQKQCTPGKNGNVGMTRRDGVLKFCPYPVDC